MNRGTALITGASSGIGEALAREFATQGFDLIITARREEKLQELSRELSENVQVEIITADLSSPDGVDHLIQSVADQQIDVLVNNAGIAYQGSFHQRPIDDVNNLLSLNINALTRLVHHFLPKMIQAGAGRILNVASVASFQPVPSLSVYAASKAFVLSLTESLSEETRGTGVSITALCPGLTKTEMAVELQGSDVPPFLMSLPADVAREGFKALMAREVIRIPGLTNQAAVTWAKHQPRWLVRGLGGLFARFNPNNRT